MSILALSVVNVFEGPEDGAGDELFLGVEEPDSVAFVVDTPAAGAGAGAGVGAFAAGGAAGAAGLAARGAAGLEPPMFRETTAGFSSGLGAGGAAGLEPPMLRDIVGGGAGADVCSGRWMGGGGGCCGWAAWGTMNPLPGTNSKAPALSLLMVVGSESVK